MLKNTFCHIPGVSVRAEQQLWESGIRCWEHVCGAITLPRGVNASIADHLSASAESLKRNDARYFDALLPADQNWRLFPEFRDSIAYVDIETTGLGRSATITTIALYDGKKVRHYVREQNLTDFLTDIRDYKVIVSYNGKAFDVPFIERSFRTKLNHVHIDLMYVLRSLGYTGGLKGCERKLGIDRKELAEVDGYFAVLLWQDYQRSRNPQSLETLLAYNVQDVLNLETLLVMAYNLKVKATPFRTTHRLPLPDTLRNPFAPDKETISRIRKANPYPFWGRRY
ncbi:MAG TPA: ribonuclease H-like domain-containing protein [Blastocatellia bacterium]|nr:ribonuclease H-like domain-containing protein [Blastocatellia bacterium]